MSTQFSKGNFLPSGPALLMEYIVEFGVFKNRLLAVGANLAGSALPIWLIIHKEMLLGTFTHIAN
jgi:hypothetical protein